MAVAFDAVGPNATSAQATGATTLSWTHTNSGSGVALTVTGAFGDTASSGKTFTAANLDPAGANTTIPTIGGPVDSGAAAGGTLAGFVQMWGLPNVSSGAHTVKLTASAVPSNCLLGGSVSYSGADTASPFSTAQTTSDSTPRTSHSITFTGSTSGNIVTVGVCDGDNTLAISAGTSRHLNNFDNATRGDNIGQADIAGGGSVTVTWTSTALDHDALIAVEVKVPAAAGGLAPKVQAGKTWKRRFRHKQQTPWLGTASVAIAGATAQVTINAETGAVTAYVQPTVQPVQPGLTWKRRFQRPRQLPLRQPPPQTRVTGATAQVTINAETGTARVGATGSAAQVTVNAQAGAVTAYVQPTAQPIQPGQTWKRRFQRPRQLPVAVPAQPTTIVGATAQVTVNAESGAVTAYVQPTAPPLVPGQTWRRRFQRPRQLPVAPPVSAVTVTGATAQVTVNAETGAVTAYVQPTAQPAQPGQTWRRRFQRPRQRTFAVPVNAVAVQGATAQVTVNAESGAITAYVQPTAQPAQPGPTWRRRFRHRAITVPPVTVSVRTPLHLGGTETDANQFGGTETTVDLLFGGQVNDSNLYGGTQADANLFGGTESDANLFGGTESDANLFGGTAADANIFGGTDLEWTMQPVNLTLAEFNDETLNVAITSNSVAYNLTGVTVQALFKTAAGVSDTDPSTITLSSPSSGITITNAAGGLATIIIPRADLANANIKFWRMDVVVGGLVNTVFYGNVTVTLL